MDRGRQTQALFLFKYGNQLVLVALGLRVSWDSRLHCIYLGSPRQIKTGGHSHQTPALPLKFYMLLTVSVLSLYPKPDQIYDQMRCPRFLNLLCACFNLSFSRPPELYGNHVAYQHDDEEREPISMVPTTQSTGAPLSVDPDAFPSGNLPAAFSSWVAFFEVSRIPCKTNWDFCKTLCCVLSLHISSRQLSFPLMCH